MSCHFLQVGSIGIQIWIVGNIIRSTLPNGGPAQDGTEFLKQNSPTQTLYLKWFKDVISRWQKHKNIFAWEVVSEINLIHGASEQDGIYFVERAAAVVQEADPYHRPVTASMGGFPEWTEVWWHNFYKSNAIAFTNIHPYPPSGHLDTEVIRQSRMMLQEYKKPVLTGESGLNATEPDRGEGKITVAQMLISGSSTRYGRASFLARRMDVRCFGRIVTEFISLA